MTTQILIITDKYRFIPQLAAIGKSYKLFMHDANYIINPIHEWQKRYEALRAPFVDRLPTQAVAQRFGYTIAYIHLLRYQFKSGKIDFSEAVKFFNLNALSSPILVKVHFDVLMTMIADTLYSMLAKKLRGFEQCDAQTIYRHFVRRKAVVHINSGTVQESYLRRAHNPILRGVPWHHLPQSLSWLGGLKLNLDFK